MSIEVKNLTKIYGEQKAVNNISFTVNKGEIVGFLGPNGAGKSTTMKIITGYLQPDEGSATVCGIDVKTSPLEAKARIGYLPEANPLYYDMYIREYLDFIADIHGVKNRKDKIDAVIKTVGLTLESKKRIGQLSKGYKQRVGLAAALIHDPQVLLLDEPTTGLDPSSRRNFLDALHRLQRERGMTVLMTSHVFSEAEDVDRVAIMREGKLLAYDSPQVLKARIGTEMVVVQPVDAETLAESLRSELGLAVRRHGDELRLEETENGEGLPMLERILERYRAQIRSISIKQPDLEDVFVHVTSRAEPEHAVPVESLKVASR